MLADRSPIVARPPWLTRFATRDGLLLYNDLTGRVLRLRGPGLTAWRAFETPRTSAGIEPKAAVERLVDGGFLVGPGADPWSIVGPRFAIRGRWATWYDRPDGGVVLAEHTIGQPDAPWSARTLNPVEALIWRLADGSRPTATLLARVATRFGREMAERGLMSMLRWTSGRLQLLKMLDGPVAEAADLPPHFFAYIDDRPITEDDAPSPQVDLDAYHRRVIADADAQFDERETTVSHLLRYPNPVLGGSAFGARLIERLAVEQAAQVVEVGGGTGWLARRALARRPDLSWMIVDLSPALLRAQRARLADFGVRLVHADGMRLPLADGAVDVLISNEVIADLPAERVDPGSPPAIVERLGVIPAAPRVTNVGALRFLEEVWRVLRPGGRAWISEYGDLDREPVEATHLDHPEVGIEFGVMLRAAQTLGFEGEVVAVMDDLTFAEVPILAAPPAQFAALRALLPALGATAPEKRAYDPEAFEGLCGGSIEPARLQPLAFASARTRLMSFPTERVRALVLRRPRPGSPPSA